MLKPIFQFDYFGLNIYLIMAVIGILFATLILLRQIKKNKVPEKEETMIIFIFLGSALFGLMMANVTNWLFMPQLFELKFMERIEQAGFNFYGGILSFLLSVFILTKISKLNTIQWMNTIVPSILIFHAFGRLGCSLAGCCYGIELYAHPLVEHTHFELFPAREIESISLFIMAYIFLKKDISKPLFMYLIFYALIRFTLEFFRGDYRGHLLSTSWSPAQVISVLLIFLVSMRLTFIKFMEKKQENIYY